jgi:phosphohistidine phosphatase
MELYIMRHGEAGKSLATLVRDGKRSLTEQGKKEVKDVAGSISALGLKFDHIVSSPLSRAAETAKIVAKTSRPRLDVEYWDELKPEGNRKELLSRVAKLEQRSSVLLVGHEPCLTSLISELIGGGGARLVLKKSGLARISLAALGPEVRGELRWLLSPRILKRVS